jgi:hypothetical protein
MKHPPWYVDEEENGQYGRHVNVRNSRAKLIASVNARTLGLDEALRLARAIAALAEDKP